MPGTNRNGPSSSIDPSLVGSSKSRLNGAPRRIKKPEGDRVRLIFGETAESFLLVLDEDDGYTSWQTVRWNNIPPDLEDQLIYIQKLGGTILDVCFAPDGRWFLQTRKLEEHVDDYNRSRRSSEPTGTDPEDQHEEEYGRRSSMGPISTSSSKQLYKNETKGNFNCSQTTSSWWGGVSPKVHKAIKDWTSSSYRLQVSFGGDGQCFMIQGNNGHWDCGYTKTDQGLKVRVEQRYEDGGKIDFTRLFPFYSCALSYIVADSEGTKWLGIDEELAKDLRINAAKERICDVTMSGDHAWAIMYPHRLCLSPNFPANLANDLHSFYFIQKSRIKKTDVALSSLHQNQADFEVAIDEAQRAKEEVTHRVEEMTEQHRKDLEEIDRLHNELKAAKIAAKKKYEGGSIKVGMKVTVQGLSRNPGDATILELNTGKDSLCVKVRFDDGTVDSSIESFKIDIFDEESLLQKLEEDIEISQQQFLSKRLELNCRRGQVFLWRGLRVDEDVGSTSLSSSNGGSMLSPKNPHATTSLEAALLNGSEPTEFVHLSHSPEIAIYYATYKSPPDDEENSQYRIAQIDFSLIEASAIFDISTQKGCDRHNIKHKIARSFAISHKIVAVKGTIPAHAILYHDISELGVPRNSRSNLDQYLNKLSKLDVVKTQVAEWQRKELQHMLEFECKKVGINSIGSSIRYPQHVVALAVARGSFSSTDEDDDTLWKQIVRHRPTVSPSSGQRRHQLTL